MVCDDEEFVQDFRWRGVADLSAVQGQNVRLRFTMTRAQLYAFWTGEERAWSTPDTSTWVVD